MTRTASTSAPLHPLLAQRWSPRSFLPTPVTDAELRSLLEAARWAPSAGNHQPSRFLVGRTGSPAYDAILDSLRPGNRAWAADVPLLVVGVARLRDPDGSARPSGPFELGLAVGQLITQSHALGLHAHAMGGFDADAVAQAFAVPDDHRAVVVVAVGHVGPPDALPDELAAREVAERRRLSLDEIAYGAAWGEPAL